MDKSWMNKNRILREYMQGVVISSNLLHNGSSNRKFVCPCKKCVNVYLVKQKLVRDHLMFHEICIGYDPWYCHGSLYRLQHLVELLIVT